LQADAIGDVHYRQNATIKEVTERRTQLCSGVLCRAKNVTQQSANKRYDTIDEFNVDSKAEYTA